MEASLGGGVLELIKAGGWMMLPILACSVIALTIIIERFWSLRQSRVLPKSLVRALRSGIQGGMINPNITQESLDKLAKGSPLGRIVAVGLMNRSREREIIRESIEDTGRHVVHELERFLNALGTIAAISPLLGLLGTVSGMIKIFQVVSTQGNSDFALLSIGIAEALITTAAGLIVAIPSLLFYRYFRRKVDELVVRMEQEAMLLVDLLHTSSARAN
jgi:biopolymer transport protein ExbB